MSADEEVWPQRGVTQGSRHYGAVVSHLSESTYGDNAPKHPFGGPNLGLVILAVVKANGDGGAVADEVTRAVLQLGRKVKFEPFTDQVIPAGFISARVQNILRAFRLRGFFTDTAPTRLTPQGEVWLNSELAKRIPDSVELQEFLSVVSETAGVKKCPHCGATIPHSSLSNTCHICPSCGGRSCDI